MKCPKCGASISTLLYCKGLDCDFTISTESFNKIVNNIYKPKRMMGYTSEESFKILNNLGHAEVAEDFSDSPFADRNK